MRIDDITAELRAQRRTRAAQRGELALRVQALKKKLLAAQRAQLEMEASERDYESQEQELVDKAATTEKRYVGIETNLEH